MSKVKYYYDPENLSYKKITPKKWRRVGFVFLFFLAAALFGFLSFIVLLNSSYLETPKDRFQAREIQNLSINYKILNKKIDQLEEVLNAIED
ncbi:MAG TPA: peptidase M23, partial [Flavobacterium sp.]|nr:peptidase M23 [Flavobacterium sp.]